MARIIDEGRAVAHGTPSELRERYSGSALTVRPRDARALTADLVARSLEHTRGPGGDVVIQVPSAAVALEVLEGQRGNVADFEMRHGSMDDVFLAVTGRSHVGGAEEQSR